MKNLIRLLTFFILITLVILPVMGCTGSSETHWITITNTVIDRTTVTEQVPGDATTVTQTVTQPGPATTHTVTVTTIQTVTQPVTQTVTQTVTATTTATVTVTAQAPIADTGTETGNLAPEFQLPDTEGQTVTLSDLRGNPVILNFWATWCGPCKHEMPFLQQKYEDWQSEGIILLTINLRETHSEATQYMESNGFSFPVLLDSDGEVSSLYQIIGIPTTFFLDKDGIIQAKKLGSFLSVDEIEDLIPLIQY